VADLALVTIEPDAAAYQGQFERVKPAAPVTARAAPSWSQALTDLRGLLRADDLVVVLAARRNTVAWDPYLERLPSRLAALVPESFVIVYPTQAAAPSTPRPEEALPAALGRTRIVAHIPARSAHAALDTLLEREYPGDLSRRRDVLRVLLHGERAGFLELTPGVAVAHARLDFVTSPRLFLGRCDGITLPGVERPCHLLFLVLSPPISPTSTWRPWPTWPGWWRSRAGWTRSGRPRPKRTWCRRSARVGRAGRWRPGARPRPANRRRARPACSHSGT
jgi:hypothetical protein